MPGAIGARAGAADLHEASPTIRSPYGVTTIIAPTGCAGVRGLGQACASWSLKTTWNWPT
jgi:hypothetical protein